MIGTPIDDRLARLRAALPRALPERLDRAIRIVFAHWLIRGYRETNAGHLVAIVAFNALIALVPTLLLLVALAGMVLHDAAALETTVHAIVATLPSADAQDALDAVLSVRRYSGWLGVVSLAGFLWIGANFADAVAHCLNQVYHVPDCGFVCTRRKGISVVLGAVGLFLIAAPAATLPTWLFAAGVDPIESTGVLAGLAPFLGYGTGFVVAVALFLLLYRVLPNAGQRLRDVWPGALVAGGAFVLLGQAFPLYLRLVGGANRFGAAFGLVWLLVTWLAAFGHIVLFGGYVNASHQQRRDNMATAARETAALAPRRESGRSA